MLKQDKIINDLIKTIEDGIEDFNKSIPYIQREILNKVIDLSKDFYIPAKTVEQQSHNFKLIARIKAELNEIILSDKYKESVKKFTGLFSEVGKIQNEYFSLIEPSFKTNPLLKQIKETNVSITVDKLTTNGIGANVTDKIRDILNKNVTTGAKFSYLVSEMSDFLKGEKGGLARYARQITTDSLNTYSAQYTKAVTEDLGLKWYKYVGSNVTKTRPFCLALIRAKESCMPYIHESQLNEIANGHICGDTVSLAGQIEGTSGENLIINRGGWNCGHQLIPVSEALVPEDLRERFK